MAIDVAASVARGDGFLIGEPVLAEGWSMTFGEAKAEATEFGAGQAEIVGTPPPSHPVWLVRLTGIGVPPGPPTGGDRAETCLEILVIMNTQPLEDIMLAGKPSDAC